MKKREAASPPVVTPLTERMPRRFSRGTLLRRVGAVGALTAVPGSIRAKVAKAAMPAMSTTPKKPAGALTAGQLATLQAMAARIIPTDATGPGATEAGAANYINLSLAGWPSARNSLSTTFPGTSVSSSLPAYLAGLPATDVYAQAKKGAPFANLSPADQDSVLTDMQNGVATGAFVGSASTFFNLVRTHTLQGMLCDPYYGGNQSFIGWKWLRYPGIRMPVKPADQALAPILLNPMSAYDMPNYKSGPPTLKG